MRQILLFSLIVLCLTMSFAQVPVEQRNIPGLNPGNRLLQYNMDMPKGVNGEQFLSGTVDIPILKDIAVRLERFYSRFGTQEQVTAGAALKYFVTPNLYTISGTEVQYNLGSTVSPAAKTNTRLNFGIGHEVKPNLFLELGYRPGLGTASPTVLKGPVIKRRNTFSLKAKF